jgi:hypothetical protein
MFSFNDARKLIIVRIIYLHRRLEIFLLQSFSLETKGAIRQATETMVKVFIDRPGKNEVSKSHVFTRFAIIGI